MTTKFAQFTRIDGTICLVNPHQVTSFEIVSNGVFRVYFVQLTFDVKHSAPANWGEDLQRFSFEEYLWGRG